MTLTRAKLLHAGAWGVLIILLLFARQYGPIDTQPWQGILIAVSVVLLIGLILLETGVGSMCSTLRFCCTSPSEIRLR